MESSRQEGLTQYADKLIRYKAWQLIGKYGFTTDDCEDLRQEMMLDLLLRLPKFNPSKAGMNTFIARIVHHKVCAIIRHRKREKRDYCLNGHSLDEPIEDVDGETHGDLLSQDDHDLITGKRSLSAIERIDMRLDIALALSELPPELKKLAERLASHSMTEVARELGVPRGTLYGAGIARLRSILEDKGFREYL